MVSPELKEKFKQARLKTVEKERLQKTIAINAQKLAKKKKLDRVEIEDGFNKMTEAMAILKIKPENYSRFIQILAIVETMAKTITDNVLADLIVSFWGNLHAISQATGIAYMTLHDRVHKTPFLKDKIKIGEMLRIDQSLGVVDHHLKINNLNAAMFILRTKGGFAETSIIKDADKDKITKVEFITIAPEQKKIIEHSEQEK